MERAQSSWTEWPRRAEAWLDGYGRPAWLAAMVLGFILVWPVGLGILGYMIWSGRMGCWGRSDKNGSTQRWRARSGGGATGNAAFDAYRDDTLRRLEEEREAFAAFLDRLRMAKDKAEFDQFMAERSAPAAQNTSAG